MLPALTNTADLQALTLAESYGYYKGYFPNQPVLDAGPTTLADRIVAIAAAIGRRPEITALTHDVATQDSKDRNSKLGDDGPFYEVAFPDGRRPWGAIVAVPGQGNFMLPPLTNTADLQALTLAESYGYYKGYFPHQPVLDAGPTTVIDRIVAIAAAIGRRRFVSLSLGA
ncbi:hypothetical protein BDZ89DRAFT_579587 [Hymenopellis radicata]|nr:hypothetical protein BDZ89DRAFT_579587 [Hymenopellis radicata]